MNLTVLDGSFAVCRLEPGAELPSWAAGSGFYSITRTSDELSVVCSQLAVPAGLLCESNWRCIEVQGPLDFTLTGILSSIAQPLAEAGISIFALSTYNTDYLMVKDDKLGHAIEVLELAGHKVACQ
jgi:hypothetical protein